MEAVTEDTVLRLAVSKGILSPADLDEAGSRCQAPEDSRLDTLVRDGLLDSRTISVLRDEAARALTAAPEGWPVREWDRYRFLSLAGEGAMGRVYKALDLRLNRVVALKFLQGSNPDLLERFRREARALAHVAHPGICEVHEVDSVEGRHYIAMQFADGESLRQAARAMSLEQKLKLMKEAAEALHEAHRSGLIHRDVKPGNIMAVHRTDGTWSPLVVDFGLAVQLETPGNTMSGAVVGTPQYMSPEQAGGRIHGLDRRTDVYGLGATLYSILTDVPPFEGASLPEIVRKVIEEVPRAPREIRPDIPRDVESIIMKCLRKSPDERYGSARELAEDLGRYLDGEPIRARKTALLYRLRMAAYRHRHEVATAATALALLATTTAWGLHHKWRSAQISRLAQAFGQQVERVEAITRHAALVPLHDTDPERRSVRERMDRISASMAEAGELAQGPGSYALGRGHLALGEYDRAREELQRAWDAGFRQPETAWSLALALERIYRTELAAADRIEGREQRDAERSRIDREYRQPILDYLHRSAGVEVETPEYVEALLAQYEGRWDDAIAKARVAFDGHPWFYEAKQLEGEVRTSLAEARANAGDIAGAGEEFRRAESALEEAIAVGSSDAGTYLALASLQSRLMLAEISNHGGDVEPYFLRGKEAVVHSLEVRPGNPDALDLLASLHRRMGEFLMSRGEDPTEHFRLATATAQASLDADPRDAGALSQIGSTFRLLAKYEQGRGRDPRASYEKAAHAYDAARDIDPASVSPSHLGLLHKSQAQWLMSRGEDPRSVLGEAIRVLEDGRRRNPADLGVLNNLGNTYATLADYEESVGEDADASRLRAAEAFRAGLELSPEHAVLLYGLGLALNQQAWKTVQRGGDPSVMLDESLDSYAHAIAVNPQTNWLAFLHDGRGYAYLLQARFERSRGANPEGSFRRAEEELRSALDANPNHIFSCMHLAEALLMQAEHALDVGKDPRAPLEDAIESANEALRINASEPVAWILLADAHRVRGRDLVERETDPREALDAGRDAARRAADFNPAEPRALIALGRLSFLEAQWRAGKALDPGPPLEEARARLEDGLQLDARNVTGLVSLLELHVFAARRLRHAGRSAREKLDEGLRTAAAALDVWEGHAEAQVLRALLLAEKAADEKDARRKEALLREADDSMTAALERNRHLERRYASEATSIREALSVI